MENNIVFNEEEIRTYLKTLADKYDSMGKSRTFYNALGKEIATGSFGADMQIELINDGPVTIWIDSKNRE